MANNQIPGQAPAAAAAAANKEIIDDEERLEDGMEHLKELHLQVCRSLDSPGRYLTGEAPDANGPSFRFGTFVRPYQECSARYTPNTPRVCPSKLPAYLEVCELTLRSPAEAYFSAFNQSVANTRKEVQDFKEALTGEESNKIFKHVTASRRAKPAGIKPWRYSDDPEWTTLKRVKREDPASK